MNLVKKSLYLCIGVLLSLTVLQGLQSLWQLSRLTTANGHIVASGAAAAQAQTLWQSFTATEEVFRQATAFIDVDSADRLRDRFGEHTAALRQAVAGLNAVAGVDAKATAAEHPAAGVQLALDQWLALAEPHVLADNVTALPALHRLEQARQALDTQVQALLAHNATVAAAAVAQSHTAAQQATVWTVVAVAASVALGLLLGWLALRSLHRQLGADASEVARVANAVANGDLAVAIDTRGLPPDSVMAATARMQQALLGTVQQVRAISGTLAGGALEIASGNNDLSLRTEQQAAALVKTSATMAQLGVTVRQNADHAAEASRLADAASQVAARGGEVVGRTVQTMQGIHESSKRINDIIGVIDGIAFQTNILALNAAVEAARAGEQGRGFAVVASEVRGLAQRSAAAAKEIKTLIGASVERVDEGGALVAQAGRTMQDVVDAIAQVTGVMARIRQASAEQSQGVGEVGQAISELDQSTQQNAALAEQSAAAAESLKGQGQQLVQAVAFFKLAAGTASS